MSHANKMTFHSGYRRNLFQCFTTLLSTSKNIILKTEILAIMARTYSLVSKTNIVGGWGKANEGICEEIECNLT